MKRHLILLLIFAGLASAAFGRQPGRGYRGFVEWSNSIRAPRDGSFGRQTQYYTGLSTSHGYQINPVVFVGAGIDFEHWSDADSNILAFFAQGRADLRLGRFTPFGDIRLGYNAASGAGVYFSPSVGYRFNWGRKVGINLGLGLTVQGYNQKVYDVGVSPDGYWYAREIGRKRGAVPFFSFRLGLDF